MQPTDEELAFVSELNGQSFTQSMEDPAVKKALTDWSQCMTDAGYAGLATPFEAADSVPHGEGKASQEEIAVALAEIDCKKKTGLVAVWFAKEVKIQKKLIAQHKDKLSDIRTRNSSAVTAANAKLAQ
ncbi:hypothetical protein ACFW40_34955 [Streptomyces sp. NPDC058807]|uniref:hypothetical protein n=1 Tax=unclassified Streptomyces TaxID=2593676 RepID=UPI0036C94AA7